jgi:hypothetical protein
MIIGQNIQLTAQAYITQDAFGAYYAAHATDSLGAEYMVRWEILDHNAECEECDACDWDKYAVTAI